MPQLPSHMPSVYRWSHDKWGSIICDMGLVISSISLFTAIILVTHLYPRLPDCFVAYLLIILALASTRGLFASLLASFLSFFLFDYLFVPPLYSLSIIKFEDILTLGVFLCAAIITSQLASALRQRARDAHQHEHETQLLYDLLRTTNDEKDIEHQLGKFAQALLAVFTPAGLRDCTFLLPTGSMPPFTSINQHAQHSILLADEEASATAAAKQGHAIDLMAARDAPFYRRFIPLRTEQQTVGVLVLSLESQSEAVPLLYWHSWRQLLRRLRMPGVFHGVSAPPAKEGFVYTPQAVFFSAFLEQAIALIERERLRHEGIRAEILQRSDDLRSALLSSVSHDLRTPLATIKTSATSLLQEHITWDEQTRKEFTQAIVQETDRLNALVENLLDMSRIEAGALHLEKVLYLPDDLMRDVIERMAYRFRDRRVNLSIEKDLPPVELDIMQMDQVLTNLLDNVLRHTPEGTPVEIVLAKKEHDILFSIADHGPGIPAGEQEQIFDKFYRVAKSQQNETRAKSAADTSQTRSIRGSGLGLAICRGIIEMHGGKIWMEPHTDEGAVFNFTLPVGAMGECI